MAGKKPVGLENSKYAKIVKFPPPFMDVCVIGVDTDDGEEHPDYDSRVELPLDEDMVQSMMERGVDKVADMSIVDGQPVAIDGRRRTLHAREAWKRLTPAQRKGHPLETEGLRFQVKRLSDVERARWAIVANNFRLNDDQVTEAEKAQRLTDMEVSDEQICRDFGWSIGTLRNRRKLVDGTLPKSVLNMVKAGSLTVSAAMALHKRAQSEDMSASELADEAKELAEGGTSKQAARAKSGGTKTGGTVRPGVRLMAKLVANEEAAKPDDRLLSDDVRKALKWALGELEASSINGLTKAIKATAPEPKKSSGKKAPPRMPPKKKGK